MADGTNSSFYEDDEDEYEEMYRYGLGVAGDLSVRAPDDDEQRALVAVPPSVLLPYSTVLSGSIFSILLRMIAKRAGTTSYINCCMQLQRGCR